MSRRNLICELCIVFYIGSSRFKGFTLYSMNSFWNMRFSSLLFCAFGLCIIFIQFICTISIVMVTFLEASVRCIPCQRAILLFPLIETENGLRSSLHQVKEKGAKKLVKSGRQCDYIFLKHEKKCPFINLEILTIISDYKRAFKVLTGYNLHA